MLSGASMGSEVLGSEGSSLVYCSGNDDGDFHFLLPSIYMGVDGGSWVVYGRRSSIHVVRCESRREEAVAGCVW